MTPAASWAVILLAIVFFIALVGMLSALLDAVRDCAHALRDIADDEAGRD
jgi:hypothetical protein